VERLTRADLGRRVVVRYRRPADGGPTFTDVVGLLERLDEDELAVRDRRDRVHRIRPADVFLAKVVPPTPERAVRDRRPPG